MKKITTIAFVAAIFLLVIGMPVIASQYTEVKVIVNEKVVTFPDQQPFIDPGCNRTYVPLRFVSQELGAEVKWEQDTQTATVKMTGKVISIKIGSSTPNVNGNTVNLDAPAIIINSRTMVPLRFIVEALDAKVAWDPETKAVKISKPNKTKELPPEKLNNDTTSSLDSNLNSTESGRAIIISTKVTPFMGKKSFVDVVVDSTNINGAVKYKTDRSSTIKNIGEMLRLTADDDGKFTVTILDNNNVSIGTVEVNVVNLTNHKYAI